MSLLNLFKTSWGPDAHRPAIEFEGKTLSFSELDAITNQVAHTFKNLGIHKGDRVAHFLPNSLELVYSLVGNFKNGSVVVPLNTAFREHELEHILGDSGVQAIVTDAAHNPVIQNVAPKLPQLKHILLAENFADLIKDGSTESPKNTHDDTDLRLIVYTSGTTGKPKGAPLTDRNLASNLATLLDAWRWTRTDTFVLALPLYHIHGLGVGLCGALCAGNFTILRRKFDATDVLQTIQDRRATLFMGVPTMYFKILEAAATRRWDISSMRLFVSGSAPLSQELFGQLKSTLGHEVLERAGMSETLMNFSNPYEGPRVAGSVGPCLPGVQVRIADKNFKDVPAGTEGEILLKGPNVFGGYWNRSELNDEVFADGWFVTGDIGKIDKNGYVYIVGRSKDLIISGGSNIYPREIEDVIESMPQVQECAVVGIPDKEFGESVKAYVVLSGGSSASETDVVEFCKSRLASYKKPKAVEFLAALPKNAMGKILKQELRNRNR